MSGQREPVPALLGLEPAEARRRLERFGPNALPAAERESPVRRILRQFRSPLIYILLAALALDLAFWTFEGHCGAPWESVAIAVILVANATLGVWQEWKADAALTRLDEMAAPRVWVRRGGRLEQVAGTDLVPGDAVRLEAGDRIPADGIAHRAHSLMVDESVLTGESVPLDRVEGDELSAGTMVVRGRVWLEVTRTGPTSAMGRLATMLGTVVDQQTPLERRLRAFGAKVAAWVLVIGVVMAAAGLWVEGLSRLGPVVLFAVALAVAAVPEGLPAILSLTLALGVERMARRRAVVRRLSAVEALGSVTVIATDKTGTLTENRLQVRALEAVNANAESDLRLAMVLANDAEDTSGAADPLETALLEAALEHGLDPDQIRDRFPRVEGRPFDAGWGFMRATVTEGDRETSWLKGAPERLLERAVLDEARQAEWRSRVEAWAAEGYRIIAFARGEGETEHGLTWLGVALLWDPPRPEVGDAIRSTIAAGVRVLMVTGDHPETARTVARTVGLPAGGVVTGDELDQLNEDELRTLVAETAIFARTRPEQKLRIVEALQARGEIVAMTGDGVNDAPALKRADIGVAMGQRGSAVSREVADLVLLDDNFATIVAAVEEGRSIYENVGKFLRFLFSTNLSEVMVVAVGFFAAVLLDIRTAEGALLLPLTAAQLLWINLVTDGAPALALGMDRNPGVLARPPRPPGAPLLDRNSLRFVLVASVAKASVALVLLGLLPKFGVSMEATRTAVFLFIGGGQLFFAYPSRRTETSPPTNRVLHAAFAATLGLQVLVVTLPFLQTGFDTTNMAPTVVLVTIGAMLVTWAIAEATARLVWSRR